MPLGDFVTDTFKAPKVGSGGRRTGLFAGPAGGGLGGAVGSGLPAPGGNIGGSVQPMAPEVGQAPPAQPVQIQPMEPVQSSFDPTSLPGPGIGITTPIDPGYPTAPPATPVVTTPTGFADVSATGSADPWLMEQLARISGQYQYGSDYAYADNDISQRMLGLKKQLLGIDQKNIGLDRDSINNRRAGTERDSAFLQQMRALYGDSYANELAKIQTQQDINLLDHQNQYVSGGAHFAPGQVYRKDRINQGADQQRENARINLEQQQIGVDRSLNSNNTQLGEYDIDLKRLDHKMEALGVNFQQLGLNSEQLTLALNKKIQDLGLDAWFSAQDLFMAAIDGQGEQAAYAQQMLAEFFGTGGQGPIPFMQG